MALWNADNLATPELSTLGGLGDLPRQPIRHSNGPSSLPRTSYTSARGKWMLTSLFIDLTDHALGPSDGKER